MLSIGTRQVKFDRCSNGSSYAIWKIWRSQIKYIALNMTDMRQDYSQIFWMGYIHQYDLWERRTEPKKLIDKRTKERLSLVKHKGVILEYV